MVVIEKGNLESINKKYFPECKIILTFSLIVLFLAPSFFPNSNLQLESFHSKPSVEIIV